MSNILPNWYDFRKQNVISEIDIKHMAPGSPIKQLVKQYPNDVAEGLPTPEQLKQIQGWNKDKGNKFDAGKPPIALMDPSFLEGVASVLGFGANKYAAHNWRNGIHYSRLISAAYRHLGAINKGEDVDPESGLSHAYHLGCCTMFLASMMHTRPDLDDRWKYVNKPSESTPHG